jgi:predicted phage terminase large subunit-like protein
MAPHGQCLAAHHLEIINGLEALSSGEIDRLMLLMPPGSAKSTYASKLFPAWWMARNPRSAVIMACHTKHLAEHFARDVRRLMIDNAARLNVFLRADERAAGRFSTEQGGEYFAIGVGGAITGRRADLALIDDPIAGFDEANSLRARDRLWNWYRTELVTRLKPGGRTIVVMTRWHCDDLASRMLGQGGWRCICLPAFAEAGDPLGRELGDALWPGWEGRDALLAKKASIGDQAFAALFQQAPISEDRTLFDVSKIAVCAVAPSGVAVRAWDLAAGCETARDPDWTAGVKLLRDNNGAFWVDDVVRVRVAPADLQDLVLRVAAQDGVGVAVGIPLDPGQAGHYQAMGLTRALAGYRVRSSPEKGSKALRADGVASQAGMGLLRLKRAAWNGAFLDELALFPNGPKDDQVDALSRAFTMLTNIAEPAHFKSVPLLAR